MQKVHSLFNRNPANKLHEILLKITNNALYACFRLKTCFDIITKMILVRSEY